MEKPLAESVQSRTRRTLTTVLVASMAMSGTTACKENEVPVTPAMSCPAITPEQINTRRDAILAAMRAPRSNRNSSERRQQKDENARRNGVHFLEGDATLAALDGVSQPEKVIKLISELTFSKLGFHLNAEMGPQTSPAQIISDAHDVLYTLASGNTTVEYYTMAGVKSVTIGSSAPGKVNAYDRPAGGLATTYADGSRDINIAPGEVVGLLNHEFGHHTHAAFTIRHCSKPTNNNDPQFTALNPPDFAYQEPPKAWKEVSIGSDYYGATSLPEDIANANSLISTDGVACDAGRSEIIASKAALTSIRWDMMHSGLGQYAIAQIQNMCV